jgi:MarR family transcriptional regulator, transcriptional regulator for hemolysin
MKQKKGEEVDSSLVSELSKLSVESRYKKIPANLRPSAEVVISFLIDDVSRLQRAALDQILKPFGASRAQWSLLSHIARHPGMKQIELAEGLDLTRVAIKLLTDRLLANGIIESHADPADRRARHIFLTKKGENLLKKLRKAGFAFLAEVSRQVSPGDRRTLITQISNMKRLILDYGQELKRTRRRL